jgi:hypothetical protein
VTETQMARNIKKINGFALSKCTGPNRPRNFGPSRSPSLGSVGLLAPVLVGPLALVPVGPLLLVPVGPLAQFRAHKTKNIAHRQPVPVGP